MREKCGDGLGTGYYSLEQVDLFLVQDGFLETG